MLFLIVAKLRVSGISLLQRRAVYVSAHAREDALAYGKRGVSKYRRHYNVPVYARHPSSASEMHAARR